MATDVLMVLDFQGNGQVSIRLSSGRKYEVTSDPKGLFPQDSGEWSISAGATTLEGQASCGLEGFRFHGASVGQEGVANYVLVPKSFLGDYRVTNVFK